MQKQRLKSRGICFSHFHKFINDLTNVYIIKDINTTVVCDTYLGPKIIEEYIRDEFENSFDLKNLLIFNSHHHWDHIWGNCFFKSNVILSQKITLSEIKEKASNEFKKFGEHSLGSVELIHPNKIFDKRYFLEESQIEFFHSPGHTLGSSSCYDLKDEILFVGDNLEDPLPYVYSREVEKYIETLEFYKNLDAKTIIPGHGKVLFDHDLLDKNHEYLVNLYKMEVPVEFLNLKEYKIHFNNVISICKEYFALNDNEKASKILEHLNENVSLSKVEKKDEYREYIKKFIDSNLRTEQ